MSSVTETTIRGSNLGMTLEDQCQDLWAGVVNVGVCHGKHRGKDDGVNGVSQRRCVDDNPKDEAPTE